MSVKIIFEIHSAFKNSFRESIPIATYCILLIVGALSVVSFPFLSQMY